MQLLSKGALNRHVAATKANTDSSRSHCVFSCVLESKCTEEGVTGIRTSCLRLVDLAGVHTSVLLLHKGALICVYILLLWSLMHAWCYCELHNRCWDRSGNHFF